MVRQALLAARQQWALHLVAARLGYGVLAAGALGVAWVPGTTGAVNGLATHRVAGLDQQRQTATSPATSASSPSAALPGSATPRVSQVSGAAAPDSRSDAATSAGPALTQISGSDAPRPGDSAPGGAREGVSGTGISSQATAVREVLGPTPSVASSRPDVATPTPAGPRPVLSPTAGAGVDGGAAEADRLRAARSAGDLFRTLAPGAPPAGAVDIVAVPAPAIPAIPSEQAIEPRRADSGPVEPTPLVLRAPEAKASEPRAGEAGTQVSKPPEPTRAPTRSVTTPVSTQPSPTPRVAHPTTAPTATATAKSTAAATKAETRTSSASSAPTRTLVAQEATPSSASTASSPTPARSPTAAGTSVAATATRR